MNLNKERKCKNIIDGNKCGVSFTGSTNFCPKCTKLRAKAKLALKKEKARKERISKKYSMSNLAILYQKLTRILTPNNCASCGIATTTNGASQAQGGHMYMKGKYTSVSLFLPNIYNQCASCNSPHGGAGRPIELSLYGEKFWGKDTMDLIHKSAQVKYSFNRAEREELYEFVNKALYYAETLTTYGSK